MQLKTTSRDVNGVDAVICDIIINWMFSKFESCSHPPEYLNDNRRILYSWKIFHIHLSRLILIIPSSHSIISNP